MVLLLCAIPLSAQQAEMYFKEANKHVDNKNYSGAIRSLNKAIAENDHEAIYYCKRGYAWFKMKENQNAYNDLTAAVKYDYTLAEAYYYRSQVLEGSLLIQDAVNDLDMVIKYAKNDSIRYEAYLKRGGNRSTLRNFKGAFEDASTYHQFDKSSRDALSIMAMSKHEMNQNEEALGYLGKIVTMYPNDTMTLMNFGFIYLSMQKWDTAYYYLDKAYRLNPKDPFILSNLSYVKLKQGDTKGALKDINASLSIAPENSWAYRNRALILLAVSDTTKACENLHLSIKKGFTDRYGNEVSDLIYQCCGKKK